MENQDAYNKAKTRVEVKFGFYKHLSIYMAVCIFLIIINLSTSMQHFWVIWPIMGWGLGLLIHGVNVFSSFKVSSIKEQMIEKEMNKAA